MEDKLKKFKNRRKPEEKKKIEDNLNKIKMEDKPINPNQPNWL
jgi:hypothetical protein